jgi:hypothetical protein
MPGHLQCFIDHFGKFGRSVPKGVDIDSDYHRRSDDAPDAPGLTSPYIGRLDPEMWPPTLDRRPTHAVRRWNAGRASTRRRGRKSPHLNPIERLMGLMHTSMSHAIDVSVGRVSCDRRQGPTASTPLPTRAVQDEQLRSAGRFGHAFCNRTTRQHFDLSIPTPGTGTFPSV